MDRMLDHLYILAMLAFGAYSQLVMRWQVSLAGQLPEPVGEKALYVLRLLANPWVMSSIMATFLAGISWMLAMTKFEISYAYPWVSLNFLIMLFFGVLLFHESFSFVKLAGTLLIMAGVVVMARG